MIVTDQSKTSRSICDVSPNSVFHTQYLELDKTSIIVDES